MIKQNTSVFKFDINAITGLMILSIPVSVKFFFSSLNTEVIYPSCHKQAIAFSDNVAFSAGFQGEATLRNAPPIQNILEAGNHPKLFWDGRQNALPTMVLKPIVNHVEMGMSNIESIALRVKA